MIGRIFISSPIVGLEKARAIAIETVWKLEDYTASATPELSPASSREALEECLQRVAHANALILLMGPQYGSTDHSGKSISQLEYEKAKNLGIKCFAFLIKPDENTPWQPEDNDSSKRERLKQFYEIVRKDCYYKATTLANLQNEIILSIRREESRNGLFLRRPSLFQTHSEYFATFRDSNKPFNLLQPFVGRDLSFVENFLNDSDHIFLLTGRGGIGKTKFLYELDPWLEHHSSEWKVSYLNPSAAIVNEDISFLGSGKNLVVIDDAEKYADLEKILGLLKDSRLNQRLKFLLAARPSGQDSIKQLISHFEEDLKQLNLSELDKTAVRELARNSLGEAATDELVERLALVSHDSPLVTAIGGRLIALGKIPSNEPLLLQQSPKFQTLVFNKILDEYTHKLPGYTADPERWDRLIRTLSALTPIYPSNAIFLDKFSNYLRRKAYEVILDLSLLEERELVYRTGRRIRLIPDVLADHILDRSCIRNNQPTGFADDVFMAFSETNLENLLRNLSEVELRRKITGAPVNLFDDIWNAIKKHFEEASHSERSELLKEFRDFAAFQPEKLLSLCKWAIDNPALVSFPDNMPDELKKIAPKLDHSWVLREIPPLLAIVAYDKSCFRTVCELLWRLGRDDSRETNPHPEHAIRTLQYLAGYALDKPQWMHDETLNLFSSWLSDTEKAYGHRYSLVPIISTFLSRDVESITSEGFQMVIRWMPLRYETFKIYRNQALQLLKQIFQEGPAREKFSIISTFGELLSTPQGRFTRVLTDEERTQWVPEQLELLQILEQWAIQTSSSVIRYLIFGKIDWPSTRAADSRVREKASQLKSSLLASQDVKYKMLCLLLEGSFSHRIDETFDEARTRRKSWTAEIIAVLLQNHDCKAILDRIVLLLKEINDFSIAPADGSLFSELGQKSPDCAKLACEEIREHPAHPMAGFLHIFLHSLRHADPDWTHVFLSACLSEKKPDNTLLKRYISHGYGRGGWIGKIGDLLSFDWEILQVLAKDSDTGVLQNLLWALGGIAKLQTDEEQRKKILDVALSINLFKDSNLADALADIFFPVHGVPLTFLSKEQLQHLLNKFLDIRDLDSGHSIMYLLSAAFTQNPLMVIDFFLKRIELAATVENEARPYQAIPYLLHGDPNTRLRVSSGTSLGEILNRFLDRLKGRVNDYGYVYWLSKLFGGIVDTVTLVPWVQERLHSKIDKEEILALAALLEGLKVDFIFAEGGLVEILLDKSSQLGPELYEKVSKIALNAASSFATHGTAGQPPPQLFIWRDRARQIAEDPEKSVPVRTFYEQITQNMEYEIKRHQDLDEEFLDDQR